MSTKWWVSVTPMRTNKHSLLWDQNYDVTFKNMHNTCVLIRSISGQFYLYIEGILPKGPYLPCISMAGRALLAGYHRCNMTCYHDIKCCFWPFGRIPLIYQGYPSHCEIFYMSLARGTSGKKESLVPLSIDWSPTLVHIFFPFTSHALGLFTTWHEN